MANRYVVTKQYFSEGDNLRGALDDLLQYLYGNSVNFKQWDGDSRMIPLTRVGYEWFKMYVIGTNVGGNLYSFSWCELLSQ
jgi:hypothetical protein